MVIVDIARHFNSTKFDRLVSWMHVCEASKIEMEAKLELQGLSLGFR